MSFRIVSKLFLVIIFAAVLSLVSATQVLAQGQSGDPHDNGGGQGSGDEGSGESQITKKDQKKINKDGNKLGDKADEVADQLGRNVVFCILAAHTTGVGTAQELKDLFNGLTDVPFGQFVAAVIMADRIDKPLADILD